MGPEAQPGCKQEQQARQQKKNKARSLQGEASRLPLLLFLRSAILVCAHRVADKAGHAPGCAARGQRSSLVGVIAWLGIGGAVVLRRISRTRGRAWKKPRGRFPPYGAVRDPAAIGMATLTSSAPGATGADGGKGSRSASRRRSVGWATVQPCPPQALPAKPLFRSPTAHALE